MMGPQKPKLFALGEIQGIADALGDTGDGLTGTEIGDILRQLRIRDVDPANTKRIRLFNALASDQNRRKNRTGVLEFIRYAMQPHRHLKRKGRYEELRSMLNEALSLCGLYVDESGVINQGAQAKSISDAVERAR